MPTSYSEKRNTVHVIDILAGASASTVVGQIQTMSVNGKWLGQMAIGMGLSMLRLRELTSICFLPRESADARLLREAALRKLSFAKLRTDAKLGYGRGLNGSCSQLLPSTNTARRSSMRVAHGSSLENYSRRVSRRRG